MKMSEPTLNMSTDQSSTQKIHKCHKNCKKNQPKQTFINNSVVQDDYCLSSQLFTVQRENDIFIRRRVKPKTPHC